jgi:hypothetical protein
LNLYIISQSINTGYDTYDSAVVAAESENDAVLIHPSADYPDLGTWASIGNVSVKLIGTATEGTGRGVICASFNAG